MAPFSTLSVRIKTAAALILGLLVILTLASISSSAAWLLALLALVVTFLAAVEFGPLCDRSGTDAVRRTGYSVVICLPAAVVFMGSAYGSAGREPQLLLSGFVLSLLCTWALIVYYGRQSVEAAASVARELPLGLLHLGFGGAVLVALARLPDPQWPLLWLLLVVCLNDSAAYLVGSRMGGPKMSPVLSPNKTWSGSLGGLACGVLVGLICERLVAPSSQDMTFGTTVFLALLTVFAAQAGDLIKSFLKRLHGVKDTGTLLPGHGGIIDRVDAVYAAAPVLYCWLLLSTP